MLKPNFRKGIFVLAAMMLILSSCSKYQKLLKSDDVMLKKAKAIEYYDKGDYNKALGLLTDIIPVFRGTSHAETLNYYYAWSHYHQGDYILAGHYFKTFTQGFPRSEHVEEFLYMSAYCKYLLSPRPSLDQTPTRDAVREMQGFVNRFPASERVATANELIDELRAKLEEKAFNTAMMYFNIRSYTAAVKTFQNLIRDYPDTPYREEAMFMIIRSHFLFAENSIEARQLERYQSVVEAHRRFLNRYPDSEFSAQANRFLRTSQDQIVRLEEIAAAPNQND